MGSKGLIKIRGLNMKLLALILSLVSFQAFASNMQQDANDINMAISVTDNVIEIQMEAPMNLVLGFSNKPETAQEKSKWSKLQDLWFNKRTSLFNLNSYQCIEEESSIEYEIEDAISYGEVLAKVVLKCNKDIKETQLQLKVKKEITKIENIKLTVFPNDSKSITLILNKAIENIDL